MQGDQGSPLLLAELDIRVGQQRRSQLSQECPGRRRVAERLAIFRRTGEGQLDPGQVLLSPHSNMGPSARTRVRHRQNHQLNDVGDGEGVDRLSAHWPRAGTHGDRPREQPRGPLLQAHGQAGLGHPESPGSLHQPAQ